MLISEIRAAEAEAKRFLDRVSELKSSDAYKQSKTDYVGGKESAALRRASSDLSTALTRMRQKRQ